MMGIAMLNPSYELRFAGLKCHADRLWNAERVEGAAARHPVLGSVVISLLHEP